MSFPYTLGKNMREWTIGNGLVVRACRLWSRCVGRGEYEDVPSTIRMVKSSNSGDEPLRTMGPSMPYAFIQSSEQAERVVAHILIFVRFQLEASHAF